ncbi:hypothetical protein IQ247_06210 [Plectonema cf. radiosum LEGE 06105]|uniref:Uncharacterized protein n=1 Tax=Plectonema cf. radiosum LEGE 06105 TaxID=945769 RepID=A0A8J7F4I6_9CYAN|nr:hypothetical protein [Plectonema radiosum]MBE9212304.1 hypothetical protein [Plectonema cf. radiosum LEGE 06105]
MSKTKDVGVLLEDATVDTPLPKAKSFRVSCQGQIFRCREYNSRGNKYFYLEKNHQYKKLTQFLGKPEELNAVLIKEAAEKILLLMEKREAEFEAEVETEKDLRTIVMELQAEVARLSKKVDSLQAG